MHIKLNRIELITVALASGFIGMLALFPLASQAQMFALAGESVPNTILELEDLKAQCIRPEERAIFEYSQALKFIQWYRSESYTPIEEDKLRTLAYGIVQHDTRQPSWPGYRDLRDISVAAEAKDDPYALSRRNFKGFSWHSIPKPRYTSGDCKAHSENWLRSSSNLERKLPPPFPEVGKWLNLAYPTDLMAISKRLHVCGTKTKFGSPTRFDAWINNNFSYSYGRREKVSPLILGQLQRELSAYGAAAEAAAKISFGSANSASCSTLDSDINLYNSRVSVL